MFVPGVVASDIPTFPEATVNVSEKPLACIFDCPVTATKEKLLSEGFLISILPTVDPAGKLTVMPSVLVIGAPPRSILVPLRYRSFHLLVLDPRS